MRTLFAFVRLELRLQLRSLRFAVFASSFFVIGSLAPAVVFILWPSSPSYLGPATFAAQTFSLLPVLTAILAFGLGIDGVQREKDEGTWPTLSLNPMGNAGYLLRRWVAIWLLLLPIVCAPVAASVVLAWLRCRQASLASFAWPLLLQVVPIVLLASAAGLALGIIGRGLLRGVLLGGVCLASLTYVLQRFSGELHLALDGIGSFLNLTEARWVLHGMWQYFRGADPARLSYPIPASASPFDASVAGEQYLAQGLPIAGTILLLLTASILFMGRMHRDLRPWHLREDNPLRNVLAFINRLRTRYSLDGGLRRGDRAALALGVIIFATSLAAQGARALHYRTAAEDRLTATVTVDQPMSPSVVPTRYQVQASLDRNGFVSSRTVVDLVNRGNGPVSSLVFSLNPNLRTADLSLSEGTAQRIRAYNLLRLDLEPPLAAGDHRVLTFDLRGRPERAVFAIDRWIGADSGALGSRSFVDVFQPNTTGRGTSRLDRSFVVPALSRRRLALSGRDLFPVPHYTLSGPGAPPEQLDITGAAWTPDAFRPTADLQIELSVPRGILVADACGGLVTTLNTDRVLHSACSLPPADFAVVGGRYVLAKIGDDGPVVAAYPLHLDLARHHLASLARRAVPSKRLWPSLPGLSSRVVVEWPDPTVHRLGSRLTQTWTPIDEYDPDLVITRGRLLLLKERRLVRRDPIDIGPILARTVAAQLLARRSVLPEQQDVFRRLYEELARLRMGSPPRMGAVVPPFSGGPGAVLVSLLDAKPTNRLYWELRFPALVFALQSRIGPAAVAEAVDRFTAEPGQGSLEELMGLFEKAGGHGLDRFITEFVQGAELPQTNLEDVHMAHRGGVWTIEGKLVNRGSGEAVCTVQALTAISSVSAQVSAAPGAPGNFSLAVHHRPQSLLLDPDQLCHRYRSMVPPPIERVDFTGEL